MRNLELTFNGVIDEYNYTANIIIDYTIEDDSFDHEFGTEKISKYPLVQDFKFVKLRITDFNNIIIIAPDWMIAAIKKDIDESKDFIKAIENDSRRY